MFYLKVLVQEVSTATIPSATAGPTHILVEEQMLPPAAIDPKEVKPEPQIQQQPTRPRPRKSVVPKKPLKKQATISVKDEETAAIKAGMDLALGIAGKEHKKYIRPNKVWVNTNTKCPNSES